jgi:hypothetical protein
MFSMTAIGDSIDIDNTGSASTARVPSSPNPVSGFGRVQINQALPGLSGPSQSFAPGQGSPPTLIVHQTGKWNTVNSNKTWMEEGWIHEFCVRIAGNVRFRATLTWMDAPATVGVRNTLVNDLDLSYYIRPASVSNLEAYATSATRTFAMTGSTTVGDRTNNVEQITIDAPNVGDIYCLQVSGYRVPTTRQPYALISAGHVVSEISYLNVPNPFHTWTGIRTSYTPGGSSPATSHYDIYSVGVYPLLFFTVIMFYH